MNDNWLQQLLRFARTHGIFARVTVLKSEGSAPREVGAWMLVGVSDQIGTIGGGALELDATRLARKLFENRVASPDTWMREVKDYPLGPSLGQCCGGFVKLLFEVFTADEVNELVAFHDLDGTEEFLVYRRVESGEPLQFAGNRKEFHTWPFQISKSMREMLSGQRLRKAHFHNETGGEFGWFVEPVEVRNIALYLYGAGHVGQAVARVLQDLEFRVKWLDFSMDRFPARDTIPGNAEIIETDQPHVVGQNAEIGAFHVVMTYSHSVDLAICHALLQKNQFGFLGLIGSKTKRQRFVKRLLEMNIDQKAIERLVCPIGANVTTGKQPNHIAIAIAAQLVEEMELRENEVANSMGNVNR